MDDITKAAVIRRSALTAVLDVLKRRGASPAFLAEARKHAIDAIDEAILALGLKREFTCSKCAAVVKSLTPPEVCAGCGSDMEPPLDEENPKKRPAPTGIGEPVVSDAAAAQELQPDRSGDLLDGDQDQYGNPRPRAGKLDGARLYGKTPQEMSKRGPRIDGVRQPSTKPTTKQPPRLL